MFIVLKDKTISFGFRKIINLYLKKIGSEMLSFNIDSHNKKIFLDVMLKGEVESLKVEIKNYKISIENGKSFIECEEIITSREWINAILELYVKNEKFEIPKEYARLLGIVV